MTTSNQITPGTTIKIDGHVYRVESSIKVTVAKGTPFVKTKLRNLVNDEIIEKNFKVGQEVQEVSLTEHVLEYLYPEGKGYLFLNTETLDQVTVPDPILGKKVDYLKEGTKVTGMFYGDTIFSVELPQFLELMIVKAEGDGMDPSPVASNTKEATLETGAIIRVPLFIETGDVVKVDTEENEYIQRV
ncbi:MAG: elongation factor P [Chlamydiota bacterium]